MATVGKGWSGLGLRVVCVFRVCVCFLRESAHWGVYKMHACMLIVVLQQQHAKATAATTAAATTNSSCSKSNSRASSNKSSSSSSMQKLQQQQQQREQQQQQRPRCPAHPPLSPRPHGRKGVPIPCSIHTVVSKIPSYNGRAHPDHGRDQKVATKWVQTAPFSMIFGQAHPTTWRTAQGFRWYRYCPKRSERTGS